MTHNGEALSRLRGIILRDLTLEQMDAVLGTTTLTPATADALEQAAIVAAGMSAQRTYANGNLPIPEKSVITTVSIGTASFETFQPDGSEIWQITAISIAAGGGAPVCTINMFDGAVPAEMHSGTASTGGGSFFPWDAPITVTATGYLMIRNTNLSDIVNVAVAYHVVSL